ncbi:16270_t:CDS:2 [Cetraspora pellucida]|uniref:16270_t:CDS:1 n=1 Tax=Cetraspora pellucida TaxID=1433469 RepID=A0A9N9A4M4_9GLOM|nr:16270_t:CDS:2 [Cetraspora pellucida]
METGQHHSLSCFNDSSKELQEHVDRFLKKFDSPLFNKREFIIGTIPLLNKLYLIDTYAKWIQQCTAPVIEETRNRCP